MKGRTGRNTRARTLTGPATISANNACSLGTALDIGGVHGAEVCRGRLPTIAGAGGSRDADTRGAVDFAGTVDGGADASGEEEEHGDKGELHFVRSFGMLCFLGWIEGEFYI